MSTWLVLLLSTSTLTPTPMVLSLRFQQTYIQFAMTHYIQAQGAQLMPTLSYQRLHTNQVLSEEELETKLKRTATNAHDLLVLQSFLTFNKAVLKTK